MVQANFPRLHAALALAGLAISAGCERRPEPAPTPAPVAEAAPAAPISPPSVNRAELLQAIAYARSTYAAGTQGAPTAEGAQAAPSLAGRSFSIRQAFGCAGPSAQTPGQAGWAWDEARKAIEIRLSPADWTASPVLAGAGGWEAVEGFWLTRPWLLGEGCPAPPIRPAGQAAPPASAPPVAGLAAVFAQGGSRVGRRDGRAFALTVRGEPTAEIPVGGYRLVIEGRFAAFPDGEAIRCRSAGVEVEPVCLAAAQVDRVAFEDAAGKLLREWRAG